MICAIQYVKTYNYLEWCDSVEQDGCFIKAKNVRVFSDVKPNVEIVQRVDWEDWRDYDLGFYNNHIVVKGVTIVPERLIRISEIVCITSYDEAHETFLTVEQAQEEANARQLQANMENSASLAFTLSKAFRFWREHQVFAKSQYRLLREEKAGCSAMQNFRT